MKKIVNVLFLLLLMMFVAAPAFAVPVFTVDTTQAVEDITAGGNGILAVSALMFGIAKIRQILKA